VQVWAWRKLPGGKAQTGPEEKQGILRAVLPSGEKRRSI